MDQLLQQIVAGLESGAYYSLIGIAIVVVMKSTDVPNFAMAAMGLLAAYVAWFLGVGEDFKMDLFAFDVTSPGWPFGVSVTIALIFAALFGAATQFFLIRPLTGLSNQPLAWLWSIGLALALFASTEARSEIGMGTRFERVEVESDRIQRSYGLLRPRWAGPRAYAKHPDTRSIWI